MNTKKILGITAHADDHVCFAGTVMKLQERGYEYSELIMTNSNEGGNYQKNNIESAKDIEETRDNEFEKAIKFLNVSKTYKLNQEDQNLQYTKELMHKVVQVIREVKPEIVITMNSEDVHPDHIATALISRESLRWAAKNFRRELGEAHRTSITLFTEGTLPIKANLLVDITEYMEKKENLFKLYDSQASSKDLELLRSFAAIRGYHLRKKNGYYAEAYSVEQNILPILFE